MKVYSVTQDVIRGGENLHPELRTFGTMDKAKVVFDEMVRNAKTEDGSRGYIVHQDSDLVYDAFLEFDYLGWHTRIEIKETEIE